MDLRANLRKDPGWLTFRQASEQARAALVVAELAAAVVAAACLACYQSDPAAAESASAAVVAVGLFEEVGRGIVGAEDHGQVGIEVESHVRVAEVH